MQWNGTALLSHKKLCRGVGIEMHSDERKKILEVLRHYQSRRNHVRPPRVGPDVFRDHRKGNKRQLRSLMLKLDHGARHVPARRYHDQRVEMMFLGPALGLNGIAERVER